VKSDCGPQSNIRHPGYSLSGAEEHEPGQHSFSFTDGDFEKVRALIYRVAGISLSPAKRDMVYSRLARRVRARELDSFSEYLEIVEGGEEQELEAFINALTTNLTSFFREPHHFQILAEHLARHPAGQRLSIWCCASSTGEEPYSIAMTVRDALQNSCGARILATDIDTKVLEKARLGVYPIDQLMKVPAEQRKRFFLKGEGKNQGFARVRDELRNLVSFRQVNLLDENWPMRGRFDYIFCRNVMIYFDKQTQHALLEKLADHLKPGGLLFVGHSESFHGGQELFSICGNTVYALKDRALHGNASPSHTAAVPVEHQVRPFEKSPPSQ
jgi:chemotaxis protein methyltransferase CheR